MCVFSADNSHYIEKEHNEKLISLNTLQRMNSAWPFIAVTYNLFIQVPITAR